MRKMLTTKLASRWVRISNESTIHQIDSINSSTTVTLLSEQEIDIGFFINFDEIVKNDTLLKIKRTFNLHNGLLPNYRGCQPIVWQMLNNEKISLMTLHVMTTSIDDGDIVFECPFNINYKKGVFLNNVQSFKSIPSTLIFGLRKILYCTAPFTRQDQYKIQTQYFKRPSAQDTRKVYFKG
ncbi:formyltransferase family protein [Chromobacterium piscinae]